MPGYLAPLLIIAVLATLGILFFGVYTMARGGEFNLKHSNKIMRARVIMQGIALLFFVIIMILAGRS